LAVAAHPSFTHSAWLKRQMLSNRSTALGGSPVATSTRPATSGARPRQATSASSQPGVATQSASVNAIQSALAARTPALRARERLPTDSRTTRAPCSSATAAVRSREPFSTTITS
jgi:hypothetical protein